MVEISTRRLKDIVEATRTIMEADKKLRELFCDCKSDSRLENAAYALLDVFFDISGEELKPEEDFSKDSKAMRLVMDKHISSEQVALILEKMQKESRKHAPPKLYTEAEIRRFLDENGGYAADRGYIPPKNVTPRDDLRPKDLTVYYDPMPEGVVGYDAFGD